MNKFKLFSHYDLAILHDWINKWLAENPDIILIYVNQSESYDGGRSYISIGIFYQE